MNAVGLCKSLHHNSTLLFSPLPWKFVFFGWVLGVEKQWWQVIQRVGARALDDCTSKKQGAWKLYFLLEHPNIFNWKLKLPKYFLFRRILHVVACMLKLLCERPVFGNCQSDLSIMMPTNKTWSRTSLMKVAYTVSVAEYVLTLKHHVIHVRSNDRSTRWIH